MKLHTTHVPAVCELLLYIYAYIHTQEVPAAEQRVCFPELCHRTSFLGNVIMKFDRNRNPAFNCCFDAIATIVFECGGGVGFLCSIN